MYVYIFFFFFRNTLFIVIEYLIEIIFQTFLLPLLFMANECILYQKRNDPTILNSFGFENIYDGYEKYLLETLEDPHD